MTDVVFKAFFEIVTSVNSETPINTRLSSKEIHDIIDLVIKTLEMEPTVLYLETDIHVVGDIHGNIVDLLRIFEKIGYPPEQKYLFLGDYVDRGNNSIEVITLLYCLKILYPKNIFLLRGNHETRNISSVYGFMNEVLRKYNTNLYNHFITSFYNLSIAAIIGGSTLCLHGGISKQFHYLSDLEVLAKPTEIPPDSIFSDIVWSDPLDIFSKFAPNTRGSGTFFSERALRQFLNRNSLSYLIRSHEMCAEGINYPYEGTKACITVFSNTNYCERMNSAAVLNFDKVMKMSIIQFDPVDASRPLVFTLPPWYLDTVAFNKLSPEFIDSPSPASSPVSLSNCL